MNVQLALMMIGPVPCGAGPASSASNQEIRACSM